MIRKAVEIYFLFSMFSSLFFAFFFKTAILKTAVMKKFKISEEGAKEKCDMMNFLECANPLRRQS